LRFAGKKGLFSSECICVKTRLYKESKIGSVVMKRVICCFLSAAAFAAYAAEPILKTRTVIETYEHDQPAEQPAEQAPATRKVAIFVANRADADLNDQMSGFEDMIIAQVTELGFEVISREIVVSATGDLLKRSGKNALDTVLDDQTSSLRLAQTLGADYLMFASFIGLDEETRTVNAYGVNYQNNIYTLRGSYRILDGNTGGSLAAGMLEPTRTIQQTKNSQTSTSGLVRELLVKASKEMAGSLKQKTAQIREVSVAKGQVQFQVAVSLDEVSFPQATIDENGHVTVTAQKGSVEALGVSVEIDGIVIGTTGSGDAPVTLSAAPGLHRIRLSRNDLIPYERMVNLQEGMNLNMVMQLSPAGLQRWRENSQTFNALLRNTKLNDAEVERIRGEAQMLRQSGYKVDIKVDTDENVTIQKNQSMMSQE
jgi:hypothetical protein